MIALARADVRQSLFGAWTVQGQSRIPDKHAVRRFWGKTCWQPRIARARISSAFSRSRCPWLRDKFEEFGYMGRSSSPSLVLLFRDFPRPQFRPEASKGPSPTQAELS